MGKTAVQLAKARYPTIFVLFMRNLLDPGHAVPAEGRDFRRPSQ